MTDFIKAVQNGDLMAAKQAFNGEMLNRVATATEEVRQEIGASVTIDGEEYASEE